VIEVEPIIYTLSHVKAGVIRHDDDDISRVTASLYTDGNLWTVVIEENWMSSPEPDIYRVTDEIRHQAVMEACMRANESQRSRSFNIYQVYEALGVELNPDSTGAQ
jgi:hypothetical protein